MNDLNALKQEKRTNTNVGGIKEASRVKRNTNNNKYTKRNDISKRILSFF